MVNENFVKCINLVCCVAFGVNEGLLGFGFVAPMVLVVNFGVDETQTQII